MRRVVILGSTGSIGTQALNVIRRNPERFDVVGLAASGGRGELLLEQVRVSQQVDRIQKEQSTLLTLAMNGGATFGASDPRELMCG